MMKYFLLYVSILLLVISCSRSEQKSVILTESKKVIIAGKVINTVPSDSTIRFVINRVGFDQEAIELLLDSTGSFHFEFQTFIPLDGG